jgi:hypothetical protein
VKTAPEVRTVTPPAGTVAASGAPTTAPSGSNASIAPSASVAPTAPASSIDPATLPAHKGVLLVTSTKEANVYLNGAFAGKVNQPFEASCGIKNVRLASAADPPPTIPPAGTWISGGQAVVIKCKALTTVDIKPGFVPPATGGGGQPPPPGGGEPY